MLHPRDLHGFRSLPRVISAGPRVKGTSDRADFRAMSSAAGTATLDPRAQRVIEEQRARRQNRLAARERRSLVASVGAFLVVAVALAEAMPTDRAPGAVTMILLVGVYALAFHLDFEVGNRIGRPDAARARPDALRPADGDRPDRGRLGRDPREPDRVRRR